jgi:hypothetical protein
MPDTDSGPDDGRTLTYTKAEFAAGIQKVLAYIMELDQEEEDDADSDIDENKLSMEELQIGHGVVVPLQPYRTVLVQYGPRKLVP